MRGPGENVILILGVLPRTGTSFLRDLFCLHPEVRSGGIFGGEDFLLHESDLLKQYVARLQSRAQARAQFFEPSAIERALGSALTEVLHRNAGMAGVYSKVISKTPDITGIENIDTFLPEASLIVIVRDGRDCVISGMASFGWTLEEGARRWAGAVDRMQHFQREHSRAAVVRYERLVADPAAAMRALLAYVDLDASQYDYEKVLNMPVRGSSDILSAGIGWDPVEKPKDFNPVGRWRTKWTKAQHDQFLSIAGMQMRDLGYDIE